MRRATSIVAVFLLSACHGGPSISPEELVRRCRDARPTWASYPEDLKAQIGAGPVATWQGALVRIDCDGTLIRAAFRLEEPWAQYDAALPILVRIPSGRVLLPADTERTTDALTYRFVLDADSAPPWIELRYPHTSRRLPLDQEGRWRPPAGA